MDVPECIATLRGERPGWFRSRVPYTEKIRCIAQLAAHDAYYDHVFLAATCDEEPLVQEAAAAVVVGRYKALKDVRQVEERYSHCPLGVDLPTFWHATRPPDEAVALINIASVNRKGHVRQAALRRMAATPDWRHIPYMLRRLGDWVPQVRDEAARTLGRYRSAPFRMGFFTAIQELESLLDVKRVDLRETVEAVLHWLLHNVAPAQLLAEVQELADAPRARMVRHLLAAFGGDAAMPRAFLADRSFLVRRMAVRHVVQRTEAWANDLLHTALHDRFPSIRTLAFKELVRRGAASEALLKEALSDMAFDVRDEAVRQLGMDREALIKHYAERIHVGEQLAGSLLGLGDRQATEWVDRMAGYAAHAAPTVRRAALFALAKVAPTEAYAQALVLVVDRNKRIRATAQAILLEHHDHGVVVRARELVRSDQEMHRAVGLGLLNNYGGWHALPDTLDACLDRSPHIATLAWMHLNAWVTYARRLFTAPDPRDVENARGALARVRAQAAPDYLQRKVLDEVVGLLG